ncbi:hypothetical protein K9N50_09920 [bacterium]|nr:hypothetical protein [bacterium]
MDSCLRVCPIIANLVVPSGLAATKSQCDLTVSAEISNVYKLAGHMPYGARPAKTTIRIIIGQIPSRE